MSSLLLDKCMYLPAEPLFNRLKRQKATIATGLRSDWKDPKPPASQFQKATTSKCSEVDTGSGLGGLEDANVEADPPAPDANLDHDNSVSLDPFLLQCSWFR